MPCAGRDHGTVCPEIRHAAARRLEHYGMLRPRLVGTGEPSHRATVMKPVARLVGYLVTFSTLVGAAAVTLMMVQIIIDVTLRNLFQIAVPGTTTLVTSYYMLIVAYLPLAVAERADSHIAVEVVSHLLGEKLQSWLIAMTWLVSAIVAGTIAYALWLEAMKAYSYGSFVIELNRSIPIWPGYFILPFGFGLYALVLAVRLACAVTGTDENDAFGVPKAPKGDLPVGEV